MNEKCCVIWIQNKIVYVCASVWMNGGSKCLLIYVPPYILPKRTLQCLYMPSLSQDYTQFSFLFFTGSMYQPHHVSNLQNPAWAECEQTRRLRRQQPTTTSNGESKKKLYKSIFILVRVVFHIFIPTTKTISISD